MNNRSEEVCELILNGIDKAITEKSLTEEERSFFRDMKELMEMLLSQLVHQIADERDYEAKMWDVIEQAFSIGFLSNTDARQARTLKRHLTSRGRSKVYDARRQKADALKEAILQVQPDKNSLKTSEKFAAHIQVQVTPLLPKEYTSGTWPSLSTIIVAIRAIKADR